MNVFTRNSLLLLVLLSSCLFFQSCKEEGCTDPNAENYNVDADDDNGSCTYARTKFIGTYGAGESCDGGAPNAVVISIVESTQDFDVINITNETLGVTVEGIVTSDSFTIDDTFILNGVAVTMVGSGSYSNTDGEEKVDVEYTLNSISTCIGIWIKV